MRRNSTLIDFVETVRLGSLKTENGVHSAHILPVWATLVKFVTSIV